MADVSSGSTSNNQTKSSPLPCLNSTHLFVELDPLDDLVQPIKQSGRIKYTCLAVCSKYIALGASTGSVYIFQKETLKYLLQLTSNDGSISKLSFSRGCKRLAVVTGDSLIVIWELNIEQRKVPVRILTSTTHKNEAITSLVWDDSGNRVFAGDARGWVTITNIDSKKPSGLFKLLSEVILKADSAIVQLDFFKSDLLVSTLTRCHICITKRKKCATVGTKLRDGQFGACYWSRPANHETGETVLLSARPGSRIWEASTQGEVQKTHQFKKLLAVVPLPVVSSKRMTVFPSSDTPVSAQSLVFSQLHPIGDHFLLAVASGGFYILNLESVEVVFWTNSIQDVKCMAVFGKDVYCLHSDQTVCKYTLCRVAHCAAKLFRRNLFQESLRVCLTFQRCIKNNSSRRHLPIQLMKDLLQKAKEVDGFEEIFVKKFEEMLVEIEANFAETVSTASSQSGSVGSGESNSVRLESGIHLVVRRRNDSDNSVGDYQDELTCKEEVSGLESLTEKSELDERMTADGDETDHPSGVVAERGGGLKTEQRSEEVSTEEEKQNSVDEGKFNCELKGRRKDLNVKGLSEEIAQETDTAKEGEKIARDGDTLSSSEMSKDEFGREPIEGTGKADKASRESSSLGLLQSEEMDIRGESGVDTCHSAVSSQGKEKHSNSAENNNSNLSSQSEHVVNSISTTRASFQSDDLSRVMQEPQRNQNPTKLSNSETFLNNSSKEAFSSDEVFDKEEEECTQEECQLKDDRNVQEFLSLPRTSENGHRSHEMQDKETDSGGINDEIVDEVFISSKGENVESLMETSSIVEEEMEHDEDGGTIHENQEQQANGLSRAENENSKSVGDVDSLIIDRNKVLYGGSSSFDEDKTVEGANTDAQSEVISPLVGERLNKDEDLNKDDRRNIETAVLGQKESDEGVTSPGSVPPFLRKDSFSAVEEDAKLIAVPTRLKEKSKKLKKSKKAARVVDIGTVMGQNAKNSKVPLKSRIKRTLSSPLPVSIPVVHTNPPVSSPSQTSTSWKSTSPVRTSPSHQLNPASQNGTETKPQMQSPVRVSPNQSDVKSGKIDEKGDGVTTATDGLANIGHSFKVVTRSLSQKLNKKSPLKRFKSSPLSPHPAPEQESVVEVKVHPFSPQQRILEEAIEMARFQLNDPSVCNDTETKKATLTIWLKVLQDVLKTVIKQAKQSRSDGISSLDQTNKEEQISTTDASVNDGEHGAEKSCSDLTSVDPHSYSNTKDTESVRSQYWSPLEYSNKQDTGLMSSQYWSPSDTAGALQALEMEEDLFMTCCQFIIDCFQSEVFQAMNEGKTEADRIKCETELMNERQVEAEPFNEEKEMIKDLQLNEDSLQINGEVKFAKEFLSDDAKDIDRHTEVTPSNQEGALLLTTPKLNLSISVETAFSGTHSSRDPEKGRRVTESSQRLSAVQEISLSDVTMEMETERDQLASHFVWQFFPLLDTDKVRDIIDAWTVRDRTFRSLLMAEEEISDDAVWIKVRDLSKENVDDILKEVKVIARAKPVLAMSCLHRMQNVAGGHFDMSDILHQCYPNIRLWEALQICQNGEECHKNIVNYMTLRMNAIHEGSREAFFQSEFRNMSLRKMLLSAALTYNHPNRVHLFCSVCEDEPIPLSNHINWPQEELIRRCLNTCRANENLEDLLEDCHHHGYWLGVVELLKVKGQRQTALDIVLKLADTDLLSEEKGLKPQSFPEWHQVLQFLQMYLPVLHSSPWQPLKNLCVNCSKKMGDSGDTLIHEELQVKLIQIGESQNCDKTDQSHSEQESDLSKEVQCSDGSGLGEGNLYCVSSNESKDCTQSKFSSVGDDANLENGETFESKMETSCKQMDGLPKVDDDQNDEKRLSKSSLSSPEQSSWKEASPERKPKSQLTWEYVASLLVGSVGSAHALKVLQAYDIPQGALSQDFYLKCLQTASIEAKQKSSQNGEKRQKEVLLTMHPLLQEYIESEICQNEFETKDSKRWSPVSDNLGLNKIHWGRTIDLNSDCQLCGWSLQSFKTDVCVYACGHTYHSGCTSGDSCIICA